MLWVRDYDYPCGEKERFGPTEVSLEDGNWHVISSTPEFVWISHQRILGTTRYLDAGGGASVWKWGWGKGQGWGRGEKITSSIRT